MCSQPRNTNPDAPVESDDLPLTSIVLLCFNQASYVEQALDSIAAQEDARIEVVVADDSSSDHSVERVRDWMRGHELPVTLLTNESNLGLCRNLNQAIGEVQGTYVAILAADDWIEPRRVTTQVEQLEAAGPTCALSYADCWLVDEGGRRLAGSYLQKHPFIAERGHDALITLLRGASLPTPAVLMRTATLRRAGPYDEALSFEDYDMWLRLARLGDFARCPVPLVNYRKHEAAMTGDGWKHLEAELLVSVEKHTGVSAEIDGIIARRIAVSAKRRYAAGRDARSTAADLRRAFALSRSAYSATNVGYYLAAKVGVHGDRLGEWGNRLRRR